MGSQSEQGEEMLSLNKGEIVSFRVQLSFVIPGWLPPLGWGVVLAEHGLSHGANPEETIQIAPVFRTSPDEKLSANQVRVSWNPDIAKQEVNLIDVDYSLSTTIPRSWTIEKQGTVPAASLQQIYEAVDSYW
jgi:hypothetical protein